MDLAAVPPGVGGRVIGACLAGERLGRTGSPESGAWARCPGPGRWRLDGQRDDPAVLDGSWKVNTSIGTGATGSFVGYRVQEQLAGIGAHTAVGRTSNVTGSFTLQGTTVTGATRRGHRPASRVPTRRAERLLGPIGRIPRLHGTAAMTVQVPLQVRLSNRVVAIAGSLPITFSDYGITPPTSFIALSVADHGTMEFQLMFTHA